MKLCKQCGKEVSDTDTYCDRCGSGQLEEIESSIKDDADTLVEEKESSEEKTTNKKSKESKKIEDGGNKKDTKTDMTSNKEEMSTSEILKMYAMFLIPIYGWYKLIKISLGGENTSKNTTNLVRANLVVLGIVIVLAVISIKLLGRLVVRI